MNAVVSGLVPDDGVAHRLRRYRIVRSVGLYARRSNPPNRFAYRRISVSLPLARCGVSNGGLL